MSKRAGLYARVSTDEQKDCGHSIDSQIRTGTEFCKRNNYSIVDVYNDGGYSGKNLQRPAMQKLLKDISDHKIDVLVAIKVDRLTRDNLDGFWILNYCEKNDVKIELILEPYDVGTANGEMMYGMNVLFGQRERKEIGARTKRGLEEMALKKIHPNKAPFGYIRNKETGHLEVDPIESITVKEVYELCAKGYSVRGIATFMKENNRYLKSGKWKSDRVYNILINPIYIGIYHMGLFTRKPEDIKIVEDYCEPIIDKNLWKRTRATLEKNKHPNYGEHIHLFTSLVKCPDCKKIMSSTLSYKYNHNKTKKTEYYFLTCKNHSCKSKGLHYNCDKIEQKLMRVLNELTMYMYNTDNEILTCNSKKSDEIKDIEKAIDKLTIQEKRLVDLYLNSNVNVETINQKNDKIRKEIVTLKNKITSMCPDDDNKEYAIELLKRLDHTMDEDTIMFYNNLSFSYIWDSLNKKFKKELINRCVSSIEIKRIENYNIEIENVKFTDEFISKTFIEYVEYLNVLLKNNHIGISYKGQINKQEADKLSKDYFIISLEKFNNDEYPKAEFDKYMNLIAEHFYTDGMIQCPCIEDNNIIDQLLLIPKKKPMLNLSNV